MCVSDPMEITGVFSALRPKVTDLPNNVVVIWLVCPSFLDQKVVPLNKQSQEPIISKTEIAVLSDNDMIYHPDIHQFGCFGEPVGQLNIRL